MRKAVRVAAVAWAAAAALAVAVIWCRRSIRRWKRAETILRKLRVGCAMPAARLWEVADAMAAEMRAGLAAEGGSSLRMLPAPSIRLPTGYEEGLFYGLELSQTKIRILHLLLGGKDNRIIEKEMTEVSLPCDIVVGSSEKLYDYVAAELVKFVSAHKAKSGIHGGRPNQVAVTVSFPVVQDFDTRSTKIEWARGFPVKEAGGTDALAALNAALDKYNDKVHFTVLANDTIGALAGGKFCFKDTVAAIILGMGTNAAYTEPMHVVPKWQDPYSKNGEMVINMEWGNFKSCKLPVTEFDVHLDAESVRPGEQMFEKLVSGMYLGDIVRRIVLKIAEETALFGDTIPSKLRMPFLLRAPDMAAMHQDTSQDLSVVGEIMEKMLGIPNTTMRMRELVVEVCDIVAKRGARLAAAGVLGVLKKLGLETADRRVVIVVEGDLYEHYRLFREYLHNGVKEMLHGRFSSNVVIKHLSDISGTGAALLAASNSDNRGYSYADALKRGPLASPISN